MAKNKKNITKQPVKKKPVKEAGELPLDIPSIEMPSITDYRELHDALQSKVNEGNETIRLESPSSFVSREPLQFSFTNTVYLQIHRGNIYHIFGSAIIAPAKYISNRAFNDPQSIVPTCLIFSNGMLGEKTDNILLLEINIKKEEFVDFTVQENLAFLSKPLPISRIKRIYALNEKIKREIVTTALLNDGGIIPEKLVCSNFPTVFSFKEPLPQTQIETTEFTLKLKKYNSILGSLAFLKNYSILLANKLEAISALPEHFFFAAQAINNSKQFQITRNDKTVSFYKQLFTLKNGIESSLLKWLFERINEDTNFSDEDVNEFGNILLNNSQNKDREFVEEAKEVLQSLKRNLDRKSAIKDIVKMRDTDKFYLYLFAMLRTYGNRSTEDKSISRADMPMFVTNTYGEYVFSLLGYFYGYTTLRNYDDRILISDPVFANNIDLPKRLPIKFEMATLFDYVIIESVYSNIFISNSDVVNTDFITSDSIKKEITRKPYNLPNSYLYTGEEVYGKFIYQYKKKSFVEELIEIANTIPLETPAVSELGVYLFRMGLPKHYINLGDLLSNSNRLPFYVYFKREDILDALKSQKINFKELSTRLELSKSFNEFK